VTPDEHIAHLERDGALLAVAADHAGWDAAVPGTQWDVRALVTHTGGVHRWAAGVVRDGAKSGDTAEGRAVGTGPGDGELLAWFREGHRALVHALRTAAPDVDCLTFLPAPSPLAFWARRQAHETAVHRADAEAARGGVTPFDTEFAQDGCAEMLLGFAARKGNAIDRAATIALRPSDDGAPWLVTLGGERIVSEQRAGDGDVVVTATSSDLYLWLWNRPSAVTVGGDPAIAELWRTVRVRWG
jgi:uncharacterized protein (TIGR03083 family)